MDNGKWKMKNAEWKTPLLRSGSRAFLLFCSLTLLLSGCIPDVVHKETTIVVPQQYPSFEIDTVSTGAVSWRTFYSDPNLVSLIDSAMHNNQELNIVMQEIILAQNEVETRKGEYLPFVNVKAGAGVDKVGDYTRNGAVEENLEVKPGEAFPKPLPDFAISADVEWEVDIWKKLRNATKSAALRYLASIEGTHFVTTSIVAEIASSYYELMALDNLLDAINATIDIQKKALNIIEQQKQAAKATELAVRKFQAEVLKNEAKRFEILQSITQTENKINFLVGRFPQHVQRNSINFLQMVKDSMHAGLPSQLLTNRPDVKQAELDMSAANLDIDVARARFYPSMNITAGAGYQAYSPQVLVTTPESMMYGLAGQLIMPLLNRKSIEAGYLSANARQTQAVYSYERTILNSFIEVQNQLSRIKNVQNSLDLKQQQVQALTQSVDIANDLFLSARADYMEVLLTQRDALEARMELIETKVDQMNAYVDLYQALGGGWR